ncbi:MAG: 5'-deoxynucleotidase [Peptococcaceae bacterium]|jgi:5'-deoxynucleotidase|nr:5'-deoxynucleotidase [Peptococcaceae bacterium]MDH7524878.1 5'-deoxynucleotidase [Peptococcaceae bacterium]
MSHFLAYLSRMKLIKRWGLMHNIYSENIQEHSLQVAVIAHCLAVIKNRFFQGNVNPERIALLAIYHEVSEIITGDLASPIKHFNPQIKQVFSGIEEVARERLLNMLPPELKPDYASLFFYGDEDSEHLRIVKVSDKISAYLKCLEELKAGNNEFIEAKKAIKAEIDRYDCPEVRYFMDKFIPSFSLTLDEMN